MKESKQKKAFLLVEAVVVMAIFMLVSLGLMFSWGALCARHTKASGQLVAVEEAIRVIENKENSSKMHPMVATLELTDHRGKLIAIQSKGFVYTQDAVCLITE